MLIITKMIQAQRFDVDYKT